MAIHDDDPRCSQRGQTLDPDVPEAARADHDARGARIEQGNRLANGVVCRDAGIGESGDVFGPGARVEFHARAR